MPPTEIGARGVTLESIDRQSIRELVRQDSEHMVDVARRGGNVYQTSLDRQDEISNFVTKLSVEDQQKFYTIYSEELQASTNTKTDQITAIHAKTHDDLLKNINSSSHVSTWISLIVFFIILSSVITMYRS